MVPMSVCLVVKLEQTQKFIKLFVWFRGRTTPFPETSVGGKQLYKVSYQRTKKEILMNTVM